MGLGRCLRRRPLKLAEATAWTAHGAFRSLNDEGRREIDQEVEGELGFTDYPQENAGQNDLVYLQSVGKTAVVSLAGTEGRLHQDATAQPGISPLAVTTPMPQRHSRPWPENSGYDTAA